MLNTVTCNYTYSRVSLFKRLTRLIAYFLLWKNLKSQRDRSLSCQEMVEAERRLVTMIQRKRFPEEIYQCVECIRQRPKMMPAQMAVLPKVRVTEAPVFSRTGVDFFGHILIKGKRDRNRNFIKTYGCVFICMVSKAVHIELATDLSTEGFLQHCVDL